ncbi:hypothetical protein ACWEQ0_27825 [Nocardia thailandica]
MTESAPPASLPRWPVRVALHGRLGAWPRAASASASPCAPGRRSDRLSEASPIPPQDPQQELFDKELDEFFVEHFPGLTGYLRSGDERQLVGLVDLAHRMHAAALDLGALLRAGVREVR